MRPEDFCVEEIPAYPPDGREGHLFLTLEKRGFTTEDAVAELARQLGIPRGEIGVAGLKDKDAVTVQWISVPATAAAALARFTHVRLRLGSPHPHGQKLRRGHLRGNRFEVVIRDLVVAPEAALERVGAKLARLAAEGGLHDYFGEQRFGHAGANVERGLAALRRRPRTRGSEFIVSAGQSVLFNLYLAIRCERGLTRTVLLGDVLKKTETGGLFTCEEPSVDQARLDRGELVITGPIFGSKMRGPGSGGPAEALELETLQRAGLAPAALTALGRRAPGTRRPLNVRIEDAQVAEAEAIGSPSPDFDGSALPSGVCLRFSLPAGAYATNLLRELVGVPA